MKIKIDSLQKKILVFTMLAIFITLFVVECIFIYETQKKLNKSVKENYFKKEQKAALEIEKINKEAVTIAMVVAEVQNAGLFQNYEYSKTYFEQILRSTETISGGYIIYEDNVSSTHNSNIKLNKSTYYSFNSFEGYGIIHSIMVSEFENKGYKILKERFYNNDPQKYYVSGLVNFKGQKIIQFDAPIIINNNFEGVAVVEVSVEKYEKALININRNIDYTIFDTYNTLINSTIENKTASRYNKYIDEYNSFNDSNDNIFRFQDNSEDKLLVKLKIKTGDWFLLAAGDESIITAPINSTILLIVIIGIAGFILSGIVLYYVSKRILNPIWKAVAISNKILLGEEVKVTVNNPNDEIGNLLLVLGDMGKIVNSLFLKVRHSITEVKLNSDDIHITYQLQNKKVSEFSEHASNILVSVEEITSKSQDLMQVTSQLLKSANETSKSAESSYGLLQQLTNQMNNLTELTKNNSQSLEKLHSVAGRISNIVTTMNKISDKTNLLALNASIEAEKAGDYGDGFALVGLEIKKLSSQINNSIFEIEEIIIEIKQAVARALTETNTFLKNVNNASADVSNTVVDVEEIIQRYKEVINQFNVIASGIDTQFADAKKIKEVVVILNKNAEQSVEYLREFYNSNILLDSAVNNLREN